MRYCLSIESDQGSAWNVIIEHINLISHRMNRNSRLFQICCGKFSLWCLYIPLFNCADKAIASAISQIHHLDLKKILVVQSIDHYIRWYPASCHQAEDSFCIIYISQLNLCYPSMATITRHANSFGEAWLYLEPNSNQLIQKHCLQPLKVLSPSYLRYFKSAT